MNLELTRELLTAADEQPKSPFRVTGRDAAHEVALLVDAGFVEASVELLQDKPTAVITQITEAGKKLLRVLRSQGPPAS